MVIESYKYSRLFHYEEALAIISRSNDHSSANRFERKPVLRYKYDRDI